METLNIRDSASTFKELAESIQKFEKRRAFILKILPELFHDIRSPVVSLMGFFELVKYDKSVLDNIAQVSEEVTDEAKVTIKRIDGLEELLSNFLNTKPPSIETCNIPETIEWLLIILGKKAARKKLQIARIFNEVLKSNSFNIDASGFKTVMLELLYALFDEAENRETININGILREATEIEEIAIEGMPIEKTLVEKIEDKNTLAKTEQTKAKNFVSLSLKIEPPRGWVEKNGKKGYSPAFSGVGISVEVCNEAGFKVNIEYGV